MKNIAGISVPQYEIFKIGTDKLKYHNWNLNISKKDAFKLQELVSLFEGQEFRIVANEIIKKEIYDIDFSKVFVQVVIDNKTDFKRATNSKGIKVNGETFRRFVGTTGGLKNNTLLFCNIKYLDELNRLCECNRNPEIKLIPAKYEAYKALTCSASQPIVNPERILVVRDCVTKYFTDVISLRTNDEEDEPIREFLYDEEFENTVSDGFNLCTIEYMEKVGKSLNLDYTPDGVCLRNAWLKGMLYPFPIVEFINEYNGGNYFIEDIWGNVQDIRECEMIVTESSLKLWSAYSSIDDYISSYKSCGYGFSVTKISPHVLDDERELNYQYLQSYEFSDDDIKELCSPTIEFLKNSMGGDYLSTLKFLGLAEDKSKSENVDIGCKNITWQMALQKNEYMLGDPYIIDSIHRLIKKKVNDAKIGRLIVNGNYQIASGDPFALMQSICGLEVTGILKSGECYSKYWVDRNVDEVVIFRSPMTSHNNIRKCLVNNTNDASRWYRYMSTIMIINGWDSFCMAENGCDYDSDILFSTNNDVLVRKYRNLPAINCMQRNAQKVIITEEEIKKTNKNGMGNQVGTITNYVTSMMEVQARFPKDSNEYKDLEYRISCGQLHQQEELDKLKGIIAKPMPKYWYNMKACGDNEYLRSICASKKPYFMIYVYDEERKKYKNYIKSSNEKCLSMFDCTIEELKSIDNKTDEQIEFLRWYDIKMPIGDSQCAMNRICRYVENELDGYKSKLHTNSKFDYNILKVKRRCLEEHRIKLKELEQYYCDCVKQYKLHRQTREEFEKFYARVYMKNKFSEQAKEICPNDDERLNIILDITYGYKGNRQFCWDCIGELIIDRLENLNVYTE